MRSPEAIKKVVVKDFEFFQDHRQVFDVNNEPLFGNSLISLSGEKWHRMRATLSPAFTGSKMRQMFELVTEYTDEAAKLLTQKSTAGPLDLEMKDFFSRFTNDIIATCAFGLKVSSIAEPNNDFFLKAQGMSPNRSLLHSMKLILIAIAPKLASALRIKFFDGEPSKKFESIILDTMNVRREQNIHRPDMINLLLQVRDGTLTHPANDEKKSEGFAAVEESEIGKRPTDRNWSDVELVAQCFLFFLAGFETVSAALTFASYEIMASPEVQQKLYDEIKEASDRLKGKRISYDELQKLKYSDQFISEVLRKWPPAFQVERMCGKNYQYEDDQRTFTIEKGQSVFIPIYGLHHDERYFPQPNQFDPERFSDENKSKIVPCSYLPFGVGPRNCIGKGAFCEKIASNEIRAQICPIALDISRLAIRIDGSESGFVLFVVKLLA